MALVLKSVEASRGTRWIGDAWRLFLRKPLPFTALFAVFMLAAAVISFVPILGAVAQIMALPLLSLGFMVASQSALLDGPVHPRQFIEPLRSDARRRRSLLTLCAIYGVALVAILVLASAMADGAWGRIQQAMAKGAAGQAELDAILAEPGVSRGAMVAVVLGALLSVPFWHAPALVHWGGHSVGQALFSSTLAVWRAKGALFLYMASWLGLWVLFGVVAAAVLGLLGLGQLVGFVAVPGLLVLSAVFYVSLLFTFNDSFGGSPVLPDGEDAMPPDAPAEPPAAPPPAAP